MTTIKTKEFTLRPIKASDAEGYHDCHQDGAARAAFTSVPETVAEAKKELQENLKKARKGLNEMFAIDVDGDFAGFVNLKLNDHPQYKHSAIIGYGIHRDHRGRGLASKAVKKATSHALNKLRLKRVAGYCRAHNKASARVMEKAGYQLEGVLRKNKRMNGRYVDDMVWAKVR